MLGALFCNFFCSFSSPSKDLVLRCREAASKACPELAEGNAPRAKATRPWSIPDLLRDAMLGIAPGGMRPSPSFRFGLDQAQKAGKRNESFAKRNETFRSAWRKSLISFRTLNQSFRGIVCFQWLKGVFVSPFFNIRLSTSEGGAFTLSAYRGLDMGDL
jgi:hypothetical protein